MVTRAVLGLGLTAAMACAWGTVGAVAVPAARHDTTQSWSVQVPLEQVSVSSTGRAGNNWSGTGGTNWGVASPAVSADGRYVAFTSAASNLVPHDTNGEPDVFVRDRETGTTVRVSVGNHGQQAHGGSTSPYISADGRYVVFGSSADNLVPSDRNQWPDVYLRDRTRKTTVLVGRTLSGGLFDGGAWPTSMSDDGRRVVFGSYAPGGPSDTNGQEDVFVRDVTTARTRLVSHGRKGGPVSEGGGNGVISGNGRYVVFRSAARDILPPGSRRLGWLFRRDLRTDRVEIVSAAADGTREDGYSFPGALSATGRYLVFWSTSTNLVDPTVPASSEPTGRRPHPPYTFARNLATGHTWPIGPAAEGSDISGDGTVVTFQTAAGVLPDDTNGHCDVFAWNRRTQTIIQVDLQPDGTPSAGVQHVGTEDGPDYTALSRDGTSVAFATNATDLVPVDRNHAGDVFTAVLTGR